MKIDIVYTWVNHEDKNWQKMYALNTKNFHEKSNTMKSAVDRARFHNRNELYYSLKSVKMYAPWYNKIHIVTNCEPPLWAKNDPDINFISHDSIFPSSKDLPTFNSHAIEACLHRIPGLTEHFLYFNDDVFLLKPLSKSDFFPKEGRISIFISKNKANLYFPQRPIDYSIINANRYLMKCYGEPVGNKLHHAPFPLLKSELEKLETTLGDCLTQTRKNKFRSRNDIPLATTLHAYHCLAIGKADRSTLPIRYIDIGHPLFIMFLLPHSPLRRGKYSILCLNENEDIARMKNLRDKLVIQFLESTFSLELLND